MRPCEIDAELATASRELLALRERLLGLEARIPPNSSDHTEDDVEVLSDLLDVRSTLLCVVEDSVRPAIESIERVRARVATGKTE